MEVKQRLTLDQPEDYRIKVPGHLDQCWSAWADGMNLTVENEGAGSSAVTKLTGSFDQASLHRLLRKLYSLGLPLISVIWLEIG